MSTVSPWEKIWQVFNPIWTSSFKVGPSGVCARHYCQAEPLQASSSRAEISFRPNFSRQPPTHPDRKSSETAFPLKITEGDVVGFHNFGQAEGLACADLGAWTPIGVSGNSLKYQTYYKHRLKVQNAVLCSITVSKFTRKWTRQINTKAPILPKRDHLNYLNIQ